jgi:hypothetical protein
MPVKVFRFSVWQGWHLNTGSAESSKFAGFSLRLPVLSVVVGRTSLVHPDKVSESGFA